MQPRTPLPKLLAGLGASALLAAAALAGLALRGAPPQSETAAFPATAPPTLAETGLTRPGTDALAPGVRPFSPQYPLWTDGATKRRWVLLPEGATIDARDPDQWSFPVGTKVWKEFAFEQRAETRYMERVADGSWLYATYVWPADGGPAVLAPEEGVRGACATGMGTRHDVPSVLDCKACHEGSPSRVLGFGALQLSARRDPAAPHATEPEPGAVTLEDLLAEGRLSGDPGAILAAGSPIAATTERERAVLGYLHGNCGGCHNGQGPLASLGMELAYRHEDVAPALRTALGLPSRYRPAGQADALRIAPGDPDHSVLALRMGSRFAAAQMPPLGTHAVDADALALVRAWIQSDLTTSAVVSALSPEPVTRESKP